MNIVEYIYFVRKVLIDKKYVVVDICVFIVIFIDIIVFNYIYKGE